MDESNTNSFWFFEALFIIFTFACSLTSLSGIFELLRDNKEKFLQYTVSTTMLCIIVIPRWIVCESIYRDVKLLFPDETVHMVTHHRVVRRIAGMTARRTTRGDW